MENYTDRQTDRQADRQTDRQFEEAVRLMYVSEIVDQGQIAQFIGILNKFSLFFRQN